MTEYQWPQLACPVVRMRPTRAPWPAGVPSGTYGPRVQATVALVVRGRTALSKRMTQQAMEEVFGVPMSVGTISPLEQATTEALAAPVEEAHYVKSQEVAPPRRDQLASREQTGVVMGGGDKRGDGVCGAAVTRWPSGPRAVG